MYLLALLAATCHERQAVHYYIVHMWIDQSAASLQVVRIILTIKYKRNYQLGTHWV